MYYWDLSAFYPEDNNFSDSDWILYPVGQKQEVSSVESWLHTSTEIQQIHINKISQKHLDHFKQDVSGPIFKIWNFSLV